jgi:hypothetical protein
MIIGFVKLHGRTVGFARNWDVKKRSRKKSREPKSEQLTAKVSESKSALLMAIWSPPELPAMDGA